MDEKDSWLEALRHTRVFADPRKFHEYVLVPEYPGGKDHIFLGTLGFRPHNAIDARELARLYEEQARERIASGNVQFARSNPYGDLNIIVIAVRGVALRTAWLHAGDEVRLVTPFSGFERDVPKG